MTAGYDPSQCLSVPGRFVLGPTQNGMSTGTYPYGSTSPIGIVSKARFVQEREYAFGNSEALARDKASAYSGKHAASIAAILTQYDPTILNLIFASSATSAGGYAGANVLSLPLPGRNVAPGLVAPSSALLFVADDYLSLPSLIVYAPIFLLASPKMEQDLALDKPLETAIVVLVGLDATQRDYQCDLLGNLSV